MLQVIITLSWEPRREITAPMESEIFLLETQPEEIIPQETIILSSAFRPGRETQVITISASVDRPVQFPGM